MEEDTTVKAFASTDLEEDDIVQAWGVVSKLFGKQMKAGFGREDYDMEKADYKVGNDKLGIGLVHKPGAFREALFGKKKKKDGKICLLQLLRPYFKETHNFVRNPLDLRISIGCKN